MEVVIFWEFIIMETEEKTKKKNYQTFLENQLRFTQTPHLPTDIFLKFKIYLLFHVDDFYRRHSVDSENVWENNILIKCFPLEYYSINL